MCFMGWDGGREGFFSFGLWLVEFFREGERKRESVGGRRGVRSDSEKLFLYSSAEKTLLNSAFLRFG